METIKAKVRIKVVLKDGKYTVDKWITRTLLIPRATQYSMQMIEIEKVVEEKVIPTLKDFVSIDKISYDIVV